MLKKVEGEMRSRGGEEKSRRERAAQEIIGDLGASDGLGMGEGMRRIACSPALLCWAFRGSSSLFVGDGKLSVPLHDRKRREKRGVHALPHLPQPVVRRLESRVGSLLHHQRDDRRVKLRVGVGRVRDAARPVRRREGPVVRGVAIEERRVGRKGRVRAEFDAELGGFGGSDGGRVCDTQTIRNESGRYGR